MAADYGSLNGSLLRNFGGVPDDSIGRNLCPLIYKGTVFRVGRKCVIDCGKRLHKVR